MIKRLRKCKWQCLVCNITSKPWPATTMKAATMKATTVKASTDPVTPTLPVTTPPTTDEMTTTIEMTTPETIEFPTQMPV